MPASEAVPAARRTPPSVFGMVLFLASELMFFGGLFAAYFSLRTVAAEWPPSDVRLDLPLTMAATVLLTVSSFTLHGGVSALRRGRHSPARAWVAATFGLGAAFLAIKGYELAVAPFDVSSHAYGSLFFTMLGAHAAHLGVGLLLLVLVLARAPGYARGPAPAEAIGYYWHFVDVVWLSIFGTIYLIR